MKTYTKNPLSLEPGGETLVIEYQDGTRETHPRIKFPKAYAIKVLAVAEKPIASIYRQVPVQTDKHYYFQQEQESDSLPF